MTPERIVALVAALILFTGFALAFRRADTARSRLADPLVLFLLVWGASLGLFALPWITYTRTSLLAWVAIYGSIAAFIIGALAAWRIVRPEPEKHPPPIDSRRLFVTWLVMLLLGLVGFAAFVRAAGSAIGFSNVLSDPVALRIAESSNAEFKSAYGLWKLLTYLNIISFVLWTLLLRLRFFCGSLWILAPLGLVSIAVFFLTGDRTLLVTTIAWTTLFHVAWRPLRAGRVLLICATSAIICLIAFIGIGQRLDKGIGAHPEIRSELTTHVGERLAPAYAYATSEPPTLTKLLADPTRPRTHGAMTFLPIVKVAHRLHAAGVPPEGVGAFYAIPFETMNLSSWLGNFYLDYGIAGCMILPAIFGFLAVASYRRGLRGIGGTWLVSVFLFVIVFSPVVNKISSSLTWELAIAGPILAVIVDPTALSRTQNMMRNLTTSLGLRTRRAALAFVAVFLVSASASVAATQRPAIDLYSRSDVIQELVSAAGRAHTHYPAGHYPTSAALASQLHVSDPRLMYIAAHSTAGTRRQIGTVYVTSRPGTLVLELVGGDGSEYRIQARTTNGKLALAARVLPAARNLLRNARLIRGVKGWVVRRSAAVSALRVEPTDEVRSSVLFVSGSGKHAARASTVRQTVQKLPITAPGTAYTLSFSIRANELSRALTPEMKFIYADGSYEFFQPASPSRFAGSFGWRRITIRGRAARDLAAIDVFAIDTGTRMAFRGRARLDRARLTLALRR